MFMFMEGLPRSGKSYETCAYYILDAIKKGRPVDAYVEGLNHQQFADMSGKTLEKVQELLQYIPVENVPEIYRHTRKDSLVVIDELQDFWPSGRGKLSPEMTTFVTQHGHEGQDIIGMGQNLNDVHNIWRRRCAKKFIFQNLDVIGKPKSYKWTSYQGKATSKDIIFIEINSGRRDYEEKYFGLYKSHSEGTTNFETFEDDRVNVFNNKAIKLGLPAAVLAAIAGVYYLVTVVFSGTGIVSQEQFEAAGLNSKPVEQQTTSFASLESQFQSQPVQTIQEPSAPLEPEEIKYAPPEDYIDEIAQQYRLRLAGVARNPTNNKVVAIVQAFDKTLHLKERFTTDELLALGWELELTGYGARLYRDDRQYVVRPWPIDPFGKVNQSTTSQL